MLHINDLTFRIAGRTLFDQATVALPSSGATGFVGRNGTGKTSLFRMITGEWHPESGSISLPRRTRVGGVAQEAPSTEQSLIDVVLAADRERTDLLAEAETATDPYRISEIHLRLTDIDAHSAEARAGSILSGLGFDAETQRGPCSALSGGWRMRVALAATLFSAPDLLLLDEPTNYLDLEGTLWLENYLNRYPHAALVISHDRDLLNNAVQNIIHLEGGKLTLYRGGYDGFAKQRRERQALQLKLKKKQETARRHMESFVERFRAKANKARQAQSRLKALERMEPIESIVEERSTPIEIPNPAKVLAPPLVQLHEASAGYGDKVVLRDINLRIDVEDRIALLGQNGNGKSTLAKILSRRMDILSGRCKHHHKLDIAYFAQHQLDELNPEQSAMEHVRALMPDATEAQVRSRTAHMGLGRDKMGTVAADLSGGEKARLLLALATFHGPHLLILDEPTNHLDVDARDALAQALLEYEGSVILISHDRHLIEASADRLLLVANGTVAPYEGDLNDYRRLVLETTRKSNRDKAKKKANKSASKKDQAAKRQAGAEHRASLNPLRQKIKQTETEIEKLENAVARHDEDLSTAGLFNDDPAKGIELGKARAETQRQLQNSLEQWTSLSAEFEAASAKDTAS